MKYTLIIALIVVNAFSQSTIKIPQNSKDNSIQLLLHNYDKTSVNKISVKVIDYPKWIKFNELSWRVDEVKPATDFSIVAVYSVDKSASLNDSSKLTFEITKSNSDKIYKSYNLLIFAPYEFKCYQNYPNPFNPSTTINYEVPQSELTTMKVYNILGQEVAILVNAIQEPGHYSVNFDGSKLSSSIYIYKLTSGSFTQTRKMMLLK